MTACAPESQVRTDSALITWVRLVLAFVYCNPELDALIDRQSMEVHPKKRRELVWAIERELAEDASRPIIFYTRAATCWHSRVKGLTMMVNSVFNGWRMEDVWLDR